jgi:hypothetical protein
LTGRVRRASRAAALALACLGAFSGPASAQPAPSAAPADPRTITEMCGVSAQSAPAFVETVRRNPRFQRQTGNSRFDLFSSSNQRSQWAATKPGEPAHPAVTCREVTNGEDGRGALTLVRKMRCDAAPAACTALLREFEALDDEVRARIAERRG